MRLKALRTEFISLASRYSPDHPDVTRIKREIKALEKETGVHASQDDLIEQMGELLHELTTAEQLYTQEHPDVKNLKRQIAALEDELLNTPAAEAPDIAPEKSGQSRPTSICRHSWLPRTARYAP